MGCQHSAPVPKAQDFYHLPSVKHMANMDDSFAPIENPGMCYSLTLEQKQIAPSSKSIQSNNFGRKRPRRQHTRTNSTSLKTTAILDKQDGTPCGHGLHVDGPYEDGQLFLRDYRNRIVAIMSKKSHPTLTFCYEISSPKSPVEDFDLDCSFHSASSTSRLSTTSTESPSKSSLNHSHSNLARKKILDDFRGTSLYTWATVHQVPHKLEYQMTLAPTNVYRRRSSEIKYTMQYCGAVLGPCQMRIDNADKSPMAWITEWENGTKTSEQVGGWDIVIGPGVDPCLMICFAAIVNQ